MIFWVSIAYLISTPFAIWHELTKERGDSTEERLRRKASDGFKSAAWMFDSEFATWSMFGAIVSGPLAVGFVVAVVVFVLPFVLIAKLVFGVELIKVDQPENVDASESPSVG